MQHFNFINFFSFTIIYSICFSKTTKLRKMEQSSQITIIINESGEQKILSNDFSKIPEKILINGILQSTKNKKYDLKATNNNITMIWNSLITDCTNMFNDCTKIKKIDLSKFDYSNVEAMDYMFNNCNSLESIIFNNINTPLIKSMSYMFFDCKSLISLDLNTFDTSSVTTMTNMFYGCNNLISLNINNFKTSQVIDMSYMFRYCQSLISLNLIQFDTTSVETIKFMFNDCNPYLIYCINESKVSSTFISLLNSNFQKVNDCSNICFTNSKSKLIKEKFICIDNCYKDDTYKFEYNNICLRKCPEGTYNSSNNPYLCKSDYLVDINNSKSSETIIIENSSNNINNEIKKNCSEKCQNCSLLSNNKNLCLICNKVKGYYPKINDNLDNNSLINCYKDPEGYYLDIEIYKPCFNSCKNCNKSGDIEQNNCLECFPNNILIDSNCYRSCPYFYFFDSLNNNNYTCTLKNECPINYKYLIEEKNQCIENCEKDNIYKYEYNNKCYRLCPYNIKTSNNKYCLNDTNNKYENNIKNQEFNMKDFFNNSNIYNNNSINDIIINIKNIIINGTLDLISNKNEGRNDLLIKDENIFYQITSSEEQNNINYDNISNIILGKCEEILKKKYNINEELTLTIFKIDYYQPDSEIPIIRYEVFHPETKKKLNLSYCKEELINFYIPVSIDEDNLFKYDPNNEYYTDICYPYTSENETDIIISDRQNEFNKNHLSLCENNCSYNGYDNINKKAKCECLFKSKELIVSEFINQSNNLSYNFINKNENSNMITMKCVSTLFTKDGLLKNIGSYILLFTFLLIIISAIFFYKFGFYLLEDDIKNIIELKKNKNLDINETKDINMKIIKNKKKKKKVKKKKSKKKIKKIKKNNIVSISNNINLNSSDNAKSFTKLELKMNKSILIPNKTLDKKNNLEKNKKFKDFNNLNDYEYNSMDYEEALKYDKRNFLKYYISLIRTKHPIIFSFFPLKDYNSLIIKIDLFFLSFSIYSFVNCLFFNESIIHKIYVDEGIYNFSYLIPYISYSFIISHTLTTIIKYLSLSERNINEIKKEESIKIASDKEYKIKKCLKIKYISFFFFSLLFILFFWYYLSSFSAVYQNTQIYLIKNILISFGFSLLYPFIINFVPAIFRIYSLKESNRESLFKFSRIIQFI